MKKIALSDNQLVTLYVNGDESALKTLIQRHEKRVFSYILLSVKNRELAEDIFQETFVKVITKLQQRKYTTSGKFGAWIMRIAHNVIMDWYREQKSDKIVEPTLENDLSNISDGDILDGNIENEYVNNQVMSDVRKLMNFLPAPQREVVYMRFFQQLSFKEISETTNVSINTALGRMRYAIINLRRMAKEYNVALQLD